MLTITPPYRDTPVDAVTCKYFSVRNPLKVLLERKDFAVVDTQDDGSGNTQINITGTLPSLTVGGTVFCNIGTFGSGLWGDKDILSSSSSAVVIDVPFSGVLAGGYINLTTDRPNYYVYARFQCTVPTILDIDGTIPFFYRKYYTAQDGVIKADISNAIRTKFNRANDSTYLTIRTHEGNNCCIFNVEFLEVWDGSTESFSSGYTFGAVKAGMEIQNIGGSNMKLYLPANAAGDKAKLLTDSTTVRHWIGLPFDIHAILGIDVVDGSNASLLSTRETVYSNNAAGATTDTSAAGVSVADQCIHRFTLLGGYSSSIDRVDFRLLGADVLTETLRVKIHHCLPNNPAYIYWLNKKGGYSYWCFSIRQQFARKVTSEGEFEIDHDNLEDQNTTSSFTGKQSENSMVVGEQFLDMNDINLMISLIESPSAYLLMNSGSWQSIGPKWREVKVDVGDYKTFDTRKSLHNFEMKIRLQESFIQRN